MAEFVKADITKLESLIKESEEAIQEFADIRNEFDRINRTLLGKWEGAGKVAYQNMTDHITEKIGGIKDILDTINNTILKDLVAQYKVIDSELAEYNRTAGEDEKGE